MSVERAEDPVIVAAIARMETLDEKLRAPTPAEVPATLDTIAGVTRTKVMALAADERFRPDQARELGDSFRDRLAYLLGEDFEENASRLASLGWPMPDDDGYAKKKSLWEQYFSDEPPAAISAEDIEVRRVSAEMLDDPGGLWRDGFGVTTMRFDPNEPYYAYENRT